MWDPEGPVIWNKATCAKWWSLFFSRKIGYCGSSWKHKKSQRAGERTTEMQCRWKATCKVIANMVFNFNLIWGKGESQSVCWSTTRLLRTKKQSVNKNKQETDVQVVIMRLPGSIWKRQKHWAWTTLHHSAQSLQQSLVPCTISIKDTHLSPLPSWCFGIACGERGGGVGCETEDTTHSLVNILWLTSC